MNPNEALFNRIFKANKRIVHAYLYSRLPNRDEVEERLQDVFVKAWERIDLLGALSDTDCSRWLLAVARNLANDSFRRSSVRCRFVQAQQAPVQSAAEDSVHDTVLQRRTHDWIDKAIACLPEDLRTPLLMQVLGGLSSAEIGALLEKPAGTIRYRVSEARKRLRAQYEQQGLA